MKRSKKVTLVLITAALASCNRYLAPAGPPASYIQPNESCDSCEMENVYNDPVYYPPYEALISQWIYAFNPYAYNCYYYGNSRRSRVGRFQNAHRVYRASRSGVVRGGWGRTAHTSVNS